MSQMDTIILLFEDAWVSRLAPLSHARAAFELSCGGYRLVDLAGRLGRFVRAAARPHLRAYLAHHRPELVEPPPAGEGMVLMVNARLAPRAGAIEQLGRWARQRELALVRCGQNVAAVLLPPGRLPPETVAHGRELDAWIEGLRLPSVEMDLPMLEYPHDLIRHHPAALAENLEDRLRRGAYREVADGVFVADGARLGQNVVTDTSRGPILLEDGAQVGAHCYLSGPAHLGRGARVLEHAAIKDGVALGHTTKIGGEIECSIIEPFTNKQHHGFLGHSYLGSWVNLGAGTCNSDLKNTYGMVTMEYQGRRVATGMQFVGCFVGDYAKTAINTGIFTGKTIGVCSMVYGFVTTNVPSFVNYARSFGQVTEVPVEVMVATQARMFKRRDVEQRPCDIQLIHDMHELTRHERQLANEPLSF